MARYQIITLVDITRSNPNRSETDALKKGQQANFNSLIQAIGMRSNLSWDWDPKFDNGALPAPLDGKANHWIWEFETERDEVFRKGADATGLLSDDLDGVPIITELNNSADIHPAVFRTKGERPNTWMSEVTGIG